jgi:FixJ family two-component response regulator
MLGWRRRTIAIAFAAKRSGEGAMNGAAPTVFVVDGSRDKGDIHTSVQAMKAGAVDFLTKPIDDDRLIAAIEEALRRDAEQRQEDALRSMINQRLGTLTRRERQVMMHVICGRLNKHIAAELGIGEKTVKVHRGRVMSKMTVRSVPELVYLGARVGLALQ